jgi:NAD dependent epimerase/dehydratase
MDYKGIRVLVTGADGFIGSHLVEHLVTAGAEVSALSYYNSFNHWGWLEDVPCRDKIKIISGDIRDYSMMQKTCTDVDIIFHLAALIAIPYSYHAPESYFDTNIKGTMHICQAALEKGVKRVIHTSTSEVYGTAQYVPMDELHPLQPQSPYSASKIGADAMAKSFHYSYHLPLVIARPFNTFGPRQSARAVIPTIITQLLNGTKRIKLGNTTPTRDFNYVHDTCRGLMLLALEKEAEGEVFNIGSGQEHSIREAFEKIRSILEVEAELEEDAIRVRPEKSEVYRLLANTWKIETLTGYRPEFSFEKGLKETIDWFRQPENRKKYKADIYNV